MNELDTKIKKYFTPIEKLNSVSTSDTSEGKYYIHFTNGTLYKLSKEEVKDFIYMLRKEKDVSIKNEEEFIEYLAILRL